jgi:DNA-binding NtrC family response regulator
MANSARILVIDDDELINEFLKEALKRQGHTVDTATSAEEGLRYTREHSYDLVFSDVKMPGASGLEVLKQVRNRFPETMVILLTAFGDVNMAVDAMKAGAFEFMLKPCSPDEISMVTRRALEFGRLKTENDHHRRDQKQRAAREEVRGSAPKMQEVYNMMEAAAPHDSTILVSGESGTGKELIARAIHFSSLRNEGPWVSINCAAFPEQLIESELFGHEKGAFTGAVKTTRGRFEVADGGTLLLDEIGEMPITLQAKLLRVLQNKVFERVGSTDPIQTNVRIVATTNRDLEEEIAKGTFRADLYYRLNVIHIKVPPLRQRREDIPQLLDHYIGHFAKMTHKPVRGIEDSALRMLTEYAWPGNVRELANSIERAVVLRQIDNGKIRRSDFPVSMALAGETAQWSLSGKVMPLKEMEKIMIVRALEETGGNRRQTAEILGIAERTLRNKINEYKLRNPSEPEEMLEEA